MSCQVDKPTGSTTVLSLVRTNLLETMADYQEIESCIVLHRGIVALNNAGVCLLEKRLHGNASQAFRDGLASMKVLESGSASACLRFDVSPFITNAVRALACADSVATALGTSAFLSVRTLSHRDNDTNLVIARSICESSEDSMKHTRLLQVTPIRIELSDHEDSSALHPNLTTAVLMYNYGLTLLILSRDKVLDDLSKARLLESAVHFFTYSSTLLMRKNCEPGYRECDIFQATTKLCLSACSLGALHQSLSQVGTAEQTSRCLARIRQLWLSLRALESYTDFLGCHGKTAPAA